MQNFFLFFRNVQMRREAVVTYVLKQHRATKNLKKFINYQNNRLRKKYMRPKRKV